METIVDGIDRRAFRAARDIPKSVCRPMQGSLLSSPHSREGRANPTTIWWYASKRSQSQYAKTPLPTNFELAFISTGRPAGLYRFRLGPYRIEFEQFAGDTSRVFGPDLSPLRRARATLPTILRPAALPFLSPIPRLSPRTAMRHTCSGQSAASDKLSSFSLPSSGGHAQWAITNAVHGSHLCAMRPFFEQIDLCGKLADLRSGSATLRWYSAT
jgi:hypothetical protein